MHRRVRPVLDGVRPQGVLRSGKLVSDEPQIRKKFLKQWAI